MNFIFYIVIFLGGKRISNSILEVCFSRLISGAKAEQFLVLKLAVIM
jgi:hypothetical protein